MPDYELTPGRVKLTLTGKVIDLDYARLLAQNEDLSLQEIVTLDKVQKHQPLSLQEATVLKAKKLIEGRKPNFFIAKRIAQQTGSKAAYTLNRAFDKQYYLDLVQAALAQHGRMGRKEIDELLWNKLPDWMNDKQKRIKVMNLLSELRRKGVIHNAGSDAKPSWALIPPSETP